MLSLGVPGLCKGPFPKILFTPFEIRSKPKQRLQPDGYEECSSKYWNYYRQWGEMLLLPLPLPSSTIGHWFPPRSMMFIQRRKWKSQTHPVESATSSWPTPRSSKDPPVGTPWKELEHVTRNRDGWYPILHARTKDVLLLLLDLWKTRWFLLRDYSTFEWHLEQLSDKKSRDRIGPNYISMSLFQN